MRVRKKRFKNKRAIRLFIKTFFISFSLMLLVVGLGVGWYAIDTIQPPDIPAIEVAGTRSLAALGGLRTLQGNELLDRDLPPHLMQFEERKPLFFTFLIFGLTEGLNANTIMVAAYNGETRQGYLISIPRDSRIDVQRNIRKLSGAYAVGRLGDRGHEGGTAQIKYEVSTLIGFRPDFYISVDYEAFISMVDAVGGVELYVPFHMRYDDPLQNLHINIPAGLQVLDGQDALRFSRYRMGNDRRQTISDYQRIEHQQQVLSAVAQELMTPASILRIPDFIDIFYDYVDSNLAIGELLWFANQARSIGSMDALHLYTLPMLGTSGAPSWYELPDEEGILELVNRTVNPLVRDITTDDLRIVR